MNPIVLYTLDLLSLFPFKLLHSQLVSFWKTSHCGYKKLYFHFYACQTNKGDIWLQFESYEKNPPGGSVIQKNQKQLLKSWYLHVIFWHPWWRVNSGDISFLVFVFDFSVWQRHLADFFHYSQIEARCHLYWFDMYKSDNITFYSQNGWIFKVIQAVSVVIWMESELISPVCPCPMSILDSRVVHEYGLVNQDITLKCSLLSEWEWPPIQPTEIWLFGNSGSEGLKGFSVLFLSW